MLFYVAGRWSIKLIIAVDSLLPCHTVLSFLAMRVCITIIINYAPLCVRVCMCVRNYCVLLFAPLRPHILPTVWLFYPSSPWQLGWKGLSSLAHTCTCTCISFRFPHLPLHVHTYVHTYMYLYTTRHILLYREIGLLQASQCQITTFNER
jgi:hypothetical protein